MKAENIILETVKDLWPVPCPKGINSREIVKRSVEFRSPPRIPYMFQFHPSATDIVVIGPLEFAQTSRKGEVGSTYVDKWGVTWEVTGKWWDHAVSHPLADLKNVDSYKLPDVVAPIAKMGWATGLGWRAGKYVSGLDPVMMFETMRSLMGFEELMMAPFTQPDGLHRLLERISGLTIDSIKTYGRMGTVSAFHYVEDWGLQTSLQVKVDTFREHYKPFYRKIIDACHENKMHFIWHNCGYIVDMFPDMIELGVDVLQLDQPRLMGHEKLISLLGGKMCMWNPVDIQWSTMEGRTDAEIRQEVADMVRAYDVKGHGGGYIAKHYPQPWDINLSPARQKLICDAFMANGCKSL
jgi:hypothetical protein